MIRDVYFCELNLLIKNTQCSVLSVYTFMEIRGDYTKNLNYCNLLYEDSIDCSELIRDCKE